MTVLLIGATGFLGRNLFHKLTDLGEDVVGTTRSAYSKDGMVSIDLGRKNEYLKIVSLVEMFGITRIVNMAASDVSPSVRGKIDEETIRIFFENLNLVLKTFGHLKLLQIGTIFRTESNDSYFAGKSLIGSLLANADVNEQVVFFNLPKVVGSGEPLGRFTSDLIQSLVLGSRPTISHPCRRRNFISVVDVVSLIFKTVENMHALSVDYPMYRTELYSNYEVAKFIIGDRVKDNEIMKFDHSHTETVCRKCPSDEDELIIQPEFSHQKTLSYFMMCQSQTVEEALRQQFENVLKSHSVKINSDESVIG
jgi:nucleoside-diphosphate-sugar epimerase